MSDREDERLEAEIERLEAENASLREAGRQAERERDEAMRERDRLIEACVVEEFKAATYVSYGGLGYRWRSGKESGFCWNREDAIRELRSATGIAAPEATSGEDR
jgi:hypothetical protein